MFGWFKRKPSRLDRLEAVVEKLATPVKKDVEDFARMAVNVPQGKPEPAAWVHDRNEYVKHYKGSAFVAIGAVARKIAMQEVKVYAKSAGKGGTELEPLPDHELVTLFEHVNPIHTQYDLWFYSVGWRLLTGDSYQWKARNGLGVARELWPVPSQWVHAVPSTTEYISGYRVKGLFGKEETLPAKNVIHISDPALDWSGNGRFYGHPTLAAAATNIDVEEYMLKRLYHQFRNFAPPGMLFESTDDDLTKERMIDLYQIMINQHALAEHSGRPMITPPGFKFMGEMLKTPREMDYARSLDSTLEQTLSVFGVPKAVVGLVADVNRASMQASMIVFCENVINPLLLHMGQHLTQQLAHELDDRLVIRFDPCVVEDMEMTRKLIDTAIKEEAVTPNEVRELLLGKGAFETGGDRPIRQHRGMAQAPFGNVTEQEIEEEPPETPADPVEGQQKALDEEIDRLVDVDSNGRLGSEVPRRFGFREVEQRAGTNGHHLSNGSQKA